MPRPSSKFYRAVCKEWHFEQCVCCGKKTNLTVHHVDKNCWNNDPCNLTWLCSSCHIQVDEVHNLKFIRQVRAYVRFFKKRVFSGNFRKPIKFGMPVVEVARSLNKYKNKDRRRRYSYNG